MTKAVCACVHAVFDVHMRPSALAANKEAEGYEKVVAKADAEVMKVEGEGYEADADDEQLLQRLARARVIIRLRQTHVYCPP